MTLYSIIFSLFILMDSVGNVPIFLSLLKEIPPKRQMIIIFRELMISLVVMIVFYFIGDLLLDALRVTQTTVKIAGGIILFLIALKMIFPASDDDGEPHHHHAIKEPFIVPLAIPLIAGPGALATIMLYAQQNLTTFTVVSGIIIAWLLSSIILMSSAWLQKLLGERVLTALERLMGLILTLMAVQMLVEGITNCVAVK